MKELRSEIFSKVKEYFDNQTLHSSDKVTVGFPCFDHNEVNQALDSLLDILIRFKFSSDIVDRILFFQIKF